MCRFLKYWWTRWCLMWAQYDLDDWLDPRWGRMEKSHFDHYEEMSAKFRKQRQELDRWYYDKTQT